MNRVAFRRSGSDYLISQNRDGVASFFLFDEQGSARQLANAAATVTDSYLYDAFGNPLLTSGSTTNPFRFVGRLGYYFDADLGDAFARARFYNTALGRFASRDPADAGSVQRYGYCANNPVLLADPSGEQFAPPFLELTPITRPEFPDHF